MRDLVKAFNEAACNVILISQENEPGMFNFIEKAYEVKESRLVHIFERKTKYPGKTYHVKADLKGFLPVYVYDPYPGYSKVAEFKNLSREEVEFYLDHIQKAIELSKGVLFEKLSGVISNHLVPLPSVAWRMFKGLPRIVIFHGSDLNFAIRKNKLMVEYLWEGLNGAKVITLAKHGKKDFLDFVGDKFKHEDVLVIQPGVNLSRFVPRADRKAAKEELVKLINQQLEDERTRKDCAKRTQIVSKIKHTVEVEILKGLFREIDVYEAKKLIEPNLTDFLGELEEKTPIITFAGKYLGTKGVQALLLAAPLIFKEIPEAKIVLVGLGSSRGILEAVREVLARKDADLLTTLLTDYEKIDPGSIQELVLDAGKDFAKTVILDSSKREEYLSAVIPEKIRNDIIFAGYLDHQRLSLLLSLTDVFVAPSLFLESFGLVAIEAAAAGATPVVTSAYGFGETDEVLRNKVIELESIPKLELKSGFVENLKNCVTKALQLPTRDIKYRRKLHKAVEEAYSWESAASRFIEKLN